MVFSLLLFPFHIDSFFNPACGNLWFLMKILQLVAAKGVEFEKEILEAEYSFITDNIGRLQDKVCFLSLFDAFLFFWINQSC